MNTNRQEMITEHDMLVTAINSLLKLQANGIMQHGQLESVLGLLLTRSWLIADQIDDTKSRSEEKYYSNNY
jgi:hypothetical protein